MLWLGPDEFLVTASPGLQVTIEEVLRGALGSSRGSVVDTSAQRTTVVLQGPLVRQVLAHGCSVDLHPAAAPVGTCVQTLLARTGIVLQVTGEDRYTRTAFSCDSSDADDLATEFAKVASQFAMEFDLWDDRPPRVLVMVSKAGHCLNDLLFRWRAGSLGGEIAAVVSNHEDLRPMAEAAGLDFVHVPNTAGTRHAAEQRLIELVEENTRPIWWCWRGTCRCCRTTCASTTPTTRAR
ncbi:sarcosine oxidase, gamma subunit family, heterotetrameric form [Lentzea albidocapillata subsp. violacea]|uniref:Sarcosine oxidase, gamma subunit family, heterotetrameric form n=1 Tax=Lentzea albidocapillata subsp. violacea TaxID=128104 RepID=A0A1G8QP23_9PSEU|nr:sarcosine oxidase, gamma subunit family, heterotetrameric form [Lentzea albidocapillata subsp. violacea]